MTIFWPSTHPSSRSPCRNASSRGGLSEGDVKLRKPIRGTFPACWAEARRGEEAQSEDSDECDTSDGHAAATVCRLDTAAIFRQPSIRRNLICPLVTSPKSRTSVDSRTTECRQDLHGCRRDARSTIIHERCLQVSTHDTIGRPSSEPPIRAMTRSEADRDRS